MRVLRLLLALAPAAPVAALQPPNALPARRRGLRLLLPQGDEMATAPFAARPGRGLTLSALSLDLLLESASQRARTFSPDEFDPLFFAEPPPDPSPALPPPPPVAEPDEAAEAAVTFERFPTFRGFNELLERLDLVEAQEAEESPRPAPASAQFEDDHSSVRTLTGR